ncbi:hypothetical protein EDD11_006966 [Mortierella claussenii]|nr:hypothetical protein EDD11_006966 [Mortierella claussenii]
MTIMHIHTDHRKTIDIGDGLIMRWSTRADTANVTLLVGDCFRRRLLSGKNVVMSEYDYALVEDTKRENDQNPIVACVSLHRHLAYYGSVNLHFGKPELIATDPAYRNKGLVRRLLFEMIHPESEARGDVLQFIPGIHHFYRQFGYEYSLYWPSNGKIESPDVIPALSKEDGKSEPYPLRQATQDDIPFLNDLSTPAQMHTNAGVGCHYDTEYWRYTVHDAIEDKVSRFDADRETRIIIDAASGKPVGYTVMSHQMFGPTLEAMALKEDKVSYLDVYESVLRQLFVHSKARQELTLKEREEVLGKRQPKTDANNGTNTAADDAKPIPFMFSLAIHERHPLSLLLGTRIKHGPKHVPGNRIYTRVKSYPIFIKTVAPELERRLAQSALAGLTGRLRLDFFRQVEGSSGKGLEVFFEKGKIIEAKEWAKPSPETVLEEKLRWKKEGKVPTVYFATFAPLTFTSLLMGKDTLEQLQWAYGENFVKDDETRLLLNTLFPKVDHRLDVFCW